MESSQIFMFTIATNGYDEIYKEYLTSHEAYAKKYGYKYVAFTKSPPAGISGTNSAWMKVAIILKALEKGYRAVFFIDSDALVRDHAPPIETLFQPGKFIYMSVTSTGRFNSGVIITLNSCKSVSFFERLLLRSDIPGFMLPKSDRCLYENGHVINMAKKSLIVQVIDPRWNYNFNTILPEGVEEYILHGRDTWHKKPRSKQKSLTLLESSVKKLREGSRFLLLKRLLKFYESEYFF